MLTVPTQTPLLDTDFLRRRQDAQRRRKAEYRPGTEREVSIGCLLWPSHLPLRCYLFG